MDKTILDCVQKFKKEKRKQFVQQIKAQRRKELLTWVSKQDLINQFKETFHSKTITSLSTILQNCKHILVNPFPLYNNIVDEEEVIGIECHIGLYRQISLQKSHQSMVSNILEIVLTIIQKYTCLQIHQQPDYQMEFYKLIDIVADQISQSQKQPQIIQWFQTKESIWLIYKIIKPLSFVNCRSCPNIFKIILQALATKVQVLQINALLLLHKIIEHSESKYLFYIYQQYFAIPYLIVKKMAQRLAKKQFDLKVFWSPLICLLKTFDEAIISYAKTGIIKICGQLIATGDQANILGALQIINAFSQIYQDKIINLLLSSQTDSSKSWLTYCVEQCIYKHSNYEIRKQFAMIITNLMFRVDLDQLKRLQSKFSALSHGLLEYLQEMLCFQHQDIQIMGLKCVDRLIMCVWKMDKHSLLGIVYSLENYNIVRHINMLNKHKLGDIREMCGDLIADIDQIKRNNGMLTM